MCPSRWETSGSFWKLPVWSYRLLEKGKTTGIILACNISGLGEAPGYSASNLVTHYDFGEELGYLGTGSLVYDMSAAPINATLINSPTYNSGGQVPSFSFNGTNQYMDTNTI